MNKVNETMFIYIEFNLEILISKFINMYYSRMNFIFYSKKKNRK